MIVSAPFSLLSRTLAPSAVRTGFFEMRRLTEIREIAPLNLWVHREAGEVLTDIARSYNVSHSTISRLS
jgi:hypothetical protein